MPGLEELYYVPLACAMGVFILLRIYSIREEQVYPYENEYFQPDVLSLVEKGRVVPTTLSLQSEGQKKKTKLDKFTKDTWNGVVRGSVVGSITGGPIGAVSGGIIYGIVSPVIEYFLSDP